jgi:hypothetical protein
MGGKMLRFVVLGACALMLAGCASVTRGTTELVTFDSEPSGAEMRSIVDYPCGGPCPPPDKGLGSNQPYSASDEEIRTPIVPGPSCVTPCSIAVARNEELIVTFTKPGFEPQTAKLSRSVSGGGGVATAGNIILGGAVGLVADAATGASTDHHPNPLRVVLIPVRSAPAVAAPVARKKR